MHWNLRQVSANTLVAGVLALTGCDPGATDSPDRPLGSIALVGAGPDDPLWPVLRATAARAARVNAMYRIDAVTPETPSPTAQVALVEDLARQGFRGLCVQPIDARATRQVFESLRGQGVVVVAIMQAIPSETPFMHSGFDEREVGAALAEALAAMISGDATVATLEAADDPVSEVRRRGFATQIAHYPRLTLLRELDCKGDPATALRQMDEAMERFPGIDGWAAMGAWPLLHPEDRPLLPARCPLVVPGLVPDTIGQISTGRCQAVIVADYERVVLRAIELCLAALEPGLPPMKTYYAPVWALTWQNLSDFESKWAKWTNIEAPATASP